MWKILLLAALVSICLSQVLPSSTTTTSSTTAKTYMSFDAFIEKFHKSYKPGSEEYTNKKRIY